MVTLYERRSLSLMALSEWGRGSPLLPPSSPISIPTNSNGASGHGCNHIMNESLNNNTSVTSIASGDNSFYNLEITELSRSPTDTRHKVWCFTPTDSPTDSPVLERKTSTDPLSPLTSPPQTPNLAMLVSMCPSTSRGIRKFSRRVCEEHLGGGPHNTHASVDRRRMVIGELIDTEQRYIHNLEILLNVYLPELEHVVAPRDLRLLFPAQLEPLLERHRELLRRLEERAREGSQFAGIVGDIFGQLCDGGNSEFVDTYSAYLNEFKVAMQTLAKYEHESLDFRQLLLKCQHSVDCIGLSLSSYLLTPVQRLPRYELLLKELLKCTPLDHPDNYYLGEAVDHLREELFRLNQSIKSCQLTCSVTRRRNTRKPSFRRFSRSIWKTPMSFSRMKRHISAANIDDYSPPDTGHLGVPLSHLTHHSSASSLYRSEENVMEADVEELEEGEVGVKVRPFSNAKRLRGSGRAASCSDLLLELEPTRLKLLSHMDTLPSITSLSPSPPPSAGGRRPVSVYSTTSSTSGIASLGQSQLDLASMVTPTDSNADSANTTPTPYSDVGEKSIKTPSRKKVSWSGAIKLLRRKTSSLGNRSSSCADIKLDISPPMDFRHIQHVSPNNFKKSTLHSRTSALL